MVRVEIRGSVVTVCELAEQEPINSHQRDGWMELEAYPPLTQQEILFTYHTPDHGFSSPRLGLWRHHGNGYGVFDIMRTAERLLATHWHPVPRLPENCCKNAT
jgi:hypothetical protein